MNAAPASSRAAGLIDVNIYLSRWPLRRLTFDDTTALVAKLRRQGVTQAWAGSFDGLLHKDLATANSRLTDECLRRGRGLLLPFGSINPKLPDWEEELRRCVEQHRMPGIRLHPNYHGYKLDDPDLVRLLGRTADRGLIVQLALAMEDERMMHPLLRVEPVDTTPLADLVRGVVNDLRYADTSRRGFLLRNFTPTEAKGTFCFVSTVKSRTYTVDATTTLSVSA